MILAIIVCWEAMDFWSIEVVGVLLDGGAYSVKVRVESLMEFGEGVKFLVDRTQAGYHAIRHEGQ